MPDTWESAQTPSAPQVVVGQAIQDLAAARLARGFIPLALLCLAGIVQIAIGALGGPALALALGAPLCAASMLAYGLRVVQRAFARPKRPWMVAAGIVSVLPPSYGLWVFGWLGLRGLATGAGWASLLGSLMLTALALWYLRAWLKIVELQKLAEIMTLGISGEGGVAT